MPLRKNRARWAILAALVLSISCSPSTVENRSKPMDPIVFARKERDLAFRVDKSSPLREEDKRRFKVLDYFDVNPAYRFQAKLQRYPRPDSILLATNTGERRAALRYGYFEFEVQQKLFRLQVYRVYDFEEGRGPYLFVPFRDATSGKESYGGGRYIDLKENTSGIYDLDFNRAYNPSCAYGKEYSCPLPPPENTLPVPIYAGEKKFSLLEGH